MSSLIGRKVRQSSIPEQMIDSIVYSFVHRNLTFYSENIRSNVKKKIPSLCKKTQGMQRLDYPPLHQDALPTQNHQRKKERSQFPLP